MEEKPGYNELREAVINDNAKALEELIRKGADLSVTDAGGNSLLMWAIDKSPNALRILLAHNVDVNHKNETGYTALAWAVLEGNEKAFRTLIDHGADINTVHQSGWTLLMEAVQQKQINIVRILLEKGVDIDIQNMQGKTAMDIAEESRAADIAQLLKDTVDLRRRRAEEEAARAWQMQRDAEVAKIRDKGHRLPRIKWKNGPGL